MLYSAPNLLSESFGKRCICTRVPWFLKYPGIISWNAVIWIATSGWQRVLTSSASWSFFYHSNLSLVHKQWNHSSFCFHKNCAWILISLMLDLIGHTAFWGDWSHCLEAMLAQKFLTQGERIQLSACNLVELRFRRTEYYIQSCITNLEIIWILRLSFTSHRFIKWCYMVQIIKESAKVMWDGQQKRDLPRSE